MYKVTITELKKTTKLLDKIAKLTILEDLSGIDELEKLQLKAKSLSQEIKAKYPAINYKTK